MQNGLLMGCVKSRKHNAKEAPGLEKIKRLKLVHSHNNTGQDTNVSENGSTAAGPMINYGDSSDWDVDDSNCSLDISCNNDDNDGDGNLATFFQELKEQTASKKASCSTTQDGPSAADMAAFQEPPSAVNSP